MASQTLECHKRVSEACRGGRCICKAHYRPNQTWPAICFEVEGNFLKNMQAKTPWHTISSRPPLRLLEAIPD